MALLLNTALVMMGKSILWGRGWSGQGDTLVGKMIQDMNDMRRKMHTKAAERWIELLLFCIDTLQRANNQKVLRVRARGPL